MRVDRKMKLKYKNNNKKDSKKEGKKGDNDKGKKLIRKRVIWYKGGGKFKKKTRSGEKKEKLN